MFHQPVVIVKISKDLSLSLSLSLSLHIYVCIDKHTNMYSCVYIYIFKPLPNLRFPRDFDLVFEFPNSTISSLSFT
jgi:arginine deiminase